MFNIVAISTLCIHSVAVYWLFLLNWVTDEPIERTSAITPAAFFSGVHLLSHYANLIFLLALFMYGFFYPVEQQANFSEFNLPPFDWNMFCRVFFEWLIIPDLVGTLVLLVAIFKCNRRLPQFTVWTQPAKFVSLIVVIDVAFDIAFCFAFQKL